jgi:protein TonB
MGIEQKDPAVLKVKDSKSRGDGTAPVAGSDATTFYSRGGAQAEDKPGYLKNLAPYYPQRAIELGQEGLVVLSVWVSQKGLPSKVEIKQSSGYPLLDKSVLTTVKKWKFSPGQIGFLAHEAQMTLPVRFRLEDAKG